MTFKLLKEIIEKNNIPEDVRLYSENDWDDRYCLLDIVYYNSDYNELALTDGTEGPGSDYRDWLCLYRDDQEKEEEVDGSTSL